MTGILLYLTVIAILSIILIEWTFTIKEVYPVPAVWYIYGTPHELVNGQWLPIYTITLTRNVTGVMI